MANELVTQKVYEIAYTEAREELHQILDAGARALKQAGLDLMPIKREMLQMPDDGANLVLDACNLLFAACLSYENAQWQIKTATDPVGLVAARIEAGRSTGVVESLFFGPTRNLLRLAMDRAPIAFYALSQSSPDLRIIDRFSR
jgi:hypothetical protein